MRRTFLPAVILLSALALAGCSAQGTSQPSGPETGPVMELPADSGFDSGGTVESDGTVDSVDPSVEGDRQVITSGHLTLTAAKPADAAAEAAQIIEKAGGRVDARSEKAPVDGDSGSAQLTVRIPSENLTDTLAELKELGEVEDVSIKEQDVTTQSRDLDARIKALRASVDRLITLMASADTTADLITIETVLSERQSNLESLESQKRSLDDQVELSTVTIYLGSKADAPVDEPDTFLSGLQAGWDAFVGFFGFLLVAFGVLLPWLVLAALAAVVIIAAVRWRTKGKAEPEAS